MASSALFKAELLTLSRSWVLRGWLVAVALTEFVVLGRALAVSGVAPVPASTLLTMHLFAFLMVWSLVIIVLSAGSVALEAEVVSDSVLSRACTRTQYIGAKIAALVATILGVYLLSSGVAAYCSWRYGANDMTVPTILTGIAVVGLAVLLLVTLGVAMSVIFNHTLFAVIAMLLLWYVAPQVFSFVGAEYLSPASLSRNLPSILKDSRAPQVVQVSGTPTSLTVVFSKDVNATQAEAVENYLVECPTGQTQQPTTAAYDPQKTTVLLGGLTMAAGDTAKVTVRDVADRGGLALSPAANSATATIAASGVKPAMPQAGVPATAPVTKKPGAKVAGRVTARSDLQPPRVAQCSATASSLKVVFTEEIDPEDAAKLENYMVESPAGRPRAPRAVSYVAGTRTAVLSGLTFETGTPVKVTVKDVKDLAGNRIASTGNSAEWSDVTTWHYVLGFGIPALLAMLLAVAVFSKRDL